MVTIANLPWSVVLTELAGSAFIEQTSVEKSGGDSGGKSLYYHLSYGKEAVAVVEHRAYCKLIEVSALFLSVV